MGLSPSPRRFSDRFENVDLLTQVVQQTTVGFVASFPGCTARTARALFAGGKWMGDSELCAGVDPPLMHKREDRLSADLSGRRVAAAAVLNEGQRSADVAPVGGFFRLKDHSVDRLIVRFSLQSPPVSGRRTAVVA